MRGLNSKEITPLLLQAAKLMKDNADTGCEPAHTEDKAHSRVCWARHFYGGKAFGVVYNLQAPLSM